MGHLEVASRGGLKRLTREKLCWCLWPRGAVVNATILEDQRDAKTSLEIFRGWRVEICHDISQVICHEMYREFCLELCHARYAIGCSATNCQDPRCPRVLGWRTPDRRMGRTTSRAEPRPGLRQVGFEDARP